MHSSIQFLLKYIMFTEKCTSTKVQFNQFLQPAHTWITTTQASEHRACMCPPNSLSSIAMSNLYPDIHHYQIGYSCSYNLYTLNNRKIHALACGFLGSISMWFIFLFECSNNSWILALVFITMWHHYLLIPCTSC